MGFIKFSQKHTVKAVRTSRITLGPFRPGGWGPIGPNYLCGLVPIGIKHLPSFGAIGPMTRATGGEVLDQI